MATKLNQYTILYKEVATFNTGRNVDLNLYTFKVTAKSEKEARAKFHATRIYTVNVRDKRFRKSFTTRKETFVKKYTIVKCSNIGQDEFINYRGEVERKFVTVLPSRMPSHVKKHFSR